MATKTAQGVKRVFETLGLSVTDERATSIAADDRSYTQVRDALLAYGQNHGGYEDMVAAYVKYYAEQNNLSGGTERQAAITQSIINGERTLDKARTDIQAHAGPPQADNPPGSTVDPTTGDVTQPGETPVIKNDGVYAGGETIRVHTDAGDRIYQIYEYPPGSGKYISYAFNDPQQAAKVLGNNYDVRTISQSQYNNTVYAEASAEEITGKSGSYQTYLTSILTEEAKKYGASDPTAVGRLLNDPEMKQIMVQAQIGNWSADQILAAQRQTHYWKDVLYPGIENLYNKGIQSPEQAYVDYQRSVESSLKELGYTPGPDGTYKDQIKKMLDKNIDADVFASQVPTFVRAVQNQQYATQLQQWAAKEGVTMNGFDDWYGLLAGQAEPKLNKIAEEASLAWAAQNQGTQGITDQQIKDLAARSQLDLSQQQQAFADFNQQILALGDAGLKKYGLNRDEVLSVAAGIAPASGRSVEEVRALVAKTAQEQGLADEKKIQFYQAYTPAGTPNTPGLATIRPEGA